jgi:Zn-dependent peptidase ImmA (M78 family)
MAEVEAFITPTIIPWAIKRASESFDTIARKLNVNPEHLRAWGNGDLHPNLREAQELAKKLNIPFGFLYLSSPPQEKLPLPDLRTLRRTNDSKLSPNFLDILYDAFRKQEWYHDYLKEEDSSIVPFIGKFTRNQDPINIASDIRNTLGIDDTLRQECDNWEEFLKRMIYRTELHHVLVFRSGIVGNNTHRKLDVQEFRGFAISDDLAPVIFINENDYKTAQIFTLAHELAHLWIGASGISNPNYALRSNQQRHIIDQFCDKVAAEILIPSDDFLMRWNGFIKLDNNLNRLARHYRVSAFVVLRRAYEFDKITDKIFNDKYEELLTRIKRKKSTGGDFYKSVLSRNSATLTKSLIMATSEGRVLPTEAARLLNVKVTRLNAVESFILFGESSHV